MSEYLLGYWVRNDGIWEHKTERIELEGNPPFDTISFKLPKNVCLDAVTIKEANNE